MTFKVIDGRLSGTKLADLLRSYRFNFAEEKDLQEAVEQIFTAERIPFEREAAITGQDRVDFMVGKVGIEIKIGFSFADVIRQLHRYAQSEKVSELVLITSRCQHQMPDEINHKRLTTVNLGYTNSL